MAWQIALGIVMAAFGLAVLADLGGAAQWLARYGARANAARPLTSRGVQTLRGARAWGGGMSVVGIAFVVIGLAR
jgi:hypothetical protein